MRLSPGLAVVPLLLLPLAGCGSDEPAPRPAGAPTSASATEEAVSAGGASASCAMVVMVDGVLYIGMQPADDVALTDRRLPAEVPSCDDTGGDGDQAEGPQPTEVRVIEGADPEQVVWWADTLMVRQGTEMSARELRRLSRAG